MCLHAYFHIWTLQVQLLSPSALQTIEPQAALHRSHLDLIRI